MDKSNIDYPKADEYRSTTVHPYVIVLFLLLAGLSMLFVSISVLYIYTCVQNGVQTSLPPIFIANSFILIGTSLTMKYANVAYLNDQTFRYQVALAGTIGLTCLFLMAQFVGWSQIGGIAASGVGGHYLYALSYLHFAHVIGGIPFLLYFLYSAVKRMKEPVSVLVYFSDPEKRLKLKLLTIYWHFLDALWIFLILLFLLRKLF